MIQRLGQWRERLSESQRTVVLEYLFSAAILLFALVLRLYRLGDWSFWGDEFFTISGREDGFNYSLLRRSLASDLIQLTVQFLGPGEFAARLVPALIGALTAPVLYFLLKPIAGKGVPLLAALLIAIAPWHVYWSQNARFYTLLLLFCALSLVFFFRALEEDRPVFLILALVFLGLALRERLVALFLAPVFALYPLVLWVFRFQKPPGLRLSRLLLFFGPLLAGALLFILPYTLQLPQWIRNFGPPTNAPQWILAGVIFYVTVPLACLAGFGAARRILLKDRTALFFALAASVPVLAMMVLSLVHYAANRYVFMSLVGWLVLAAFAVQDLFDFLADREKVLAVGVLALLLAVCATDLGLYFSTRNGNRQDWKGALLFIRENALPGDDVVVSDTGLGEYYLDEPPLPYEGFEWSKLGQGEQRVWFVEEENAWKSFSEGVAWVQQHGRLMAVFDVVLPARVFPMRVYLVDPAWVENRPSGLDEARTELMEMGP